MFVSEKDANNFSKVMKSTILILLVVARTMSTVELWDFMAYFVFCFFGDKVTSISH